ncbi:MAG: hypothetical protein M3Q07_07665 [Pseudobdellovibrionaceae bacterium]|nr:hypothetical protein [Pseudobdellovibrionaceae bacterium]
MLKLLRNLGLLLLFSYHTHAYAQLSTNHFDMVMYIGKIVFNISSPGGYSSNFTEIFTRNCGNGQCTEKQICQYLNLGSVYPMDCSYATDRISYFDPKEAGFNAFLHALPKPQSCTDAAVNSPGRLIIDLDGKGDGYWQQCFKDIATVQAPYIANKEEVLRILGFDGNHNNAPAVLFGFEDGRFFRIDPTYGHSAYLSSGWDKLQAATSHNGSIYAMQNRYLHRVDPATGAWTVLGPQHWVSTRSLLTGLHDHLYSIHNGQLYLINPADGARQAIGGSRDWLGASSMAASSPHLYVIQNNRLHEVNFHNGAWRVLGGADWQGPTLMNYAHGSLYIVQAGSLHRVNPANGAWALIGRAGDWNGAASMTFADGNLYIVQNTTLHRVNPDNGSWQIVGPTGSRHSTFLVGR